MTALQPPPSSPTHSVNPDHSTFGTATLHAENRTTNPPYGRRAGWRDRLFILCLRAGDIYRRGSQPCGKYRDAYQRVCRRNGNNQYALPHQLVSSHSCSTTCCTSAPTHHPGFHSPANAACLLPQRFRRSRTHPHRFTSCGHPPLAFPITLWFRLDGTQVNLVCCFLFGIFP